MKPASLNAEMTSADGRALPVAVRGLDDGGSTGGPADHLGDLALAFRDEFKLGGLIEEMAIVASLKAIADEPAAPERWLALFNSPLGAALRARGRDLNTAMGFVLSQLPKKPS